jgi:hypothetical protein
MKKVLDAILKGLPWSCRLLRSGRDYEATYQGARGVDEGSGTDRVSWV